MVPVSSRDNGRIFVEPIQRLSASGVNGWISLRNMDNQRLSYISPGVVTFVEAYGNLTLDVDGVSEEIRPTDRFRLEGGFRAQATENGRICIFGSAKSLLKNQVRMNPTKFENTRKISDFSVLIPILGFILAAFIFPVRNRLQSNDKFRWISALDRST